MAVCGVCQTMANLSIDSLFGHHHILAMQGKTSQLSISIMEVQRMDIQRLPFFEVINDSHRASYHGHNRDCLSPGAIH